MILNCAIIDEDPEALALLKHYVEDTPSLNLIGAYHNAIEAVDGIQPKGSCISHNRAHSS